MDIIINFVIFALSFFVGIFGFCQIVGTIKYFSSFRIASALFTVTFWGIILTLGFMAVDTYLNEYKIATIIGYVFSFLLSLGTKPDKSSTSKNHRPNSILNDTEINIDIAIMSEDDRQTYITLQKAISNLSETYNNAVNDLGDNTVEDVEIAYRYNQITTEQYEEFKNAVESLTFMKETLPTTINEMQDELSALVDKYR